VQVWLGIIEVVKGTAHEHPTESQNDKWDTLQACGPHGHA